MARFLHESATGGRHRSPGRAGSVLAEARCSHCQQRSTAEDSRCAVVAARGPGPGLVIYGSIVGPQPRGGLGPFDLVTENGHRAYMCRDGLPAFTGNDFLAIYHIQLTNGSYHLRSFGATNNLADIRVKAR